MITDVEYMQIVSEAYDLSDYATKKKVLFCNEAKKVDNIEHIVMRLYELIKNDCTGIDFGSIPKSRGVVTRIENYTELIDCINQVSELVRNYKENTTIINEISTAISNINNRERQFTKAFALNIEMPIMIYNITMLSAISAVSLLLSSCVEYVKNGHDSFSISFDKVGYYKSKDHVLYEYLTQFNRNCSNGSIDKLINECIKNNVVAESVIDDEDEVIDEGVKDVLAAAGKTFMQTNGSLMTRTGKAALSSFDKMGTVGKIVTIIIGLGVSAYYALKIIRLAIKWFLNMKMKVSDWFEIQSEFLRINAENLKYRDDPKGEDHRKEVYQSQMKWVDRFKKIANIFAIKDNKAKKEVADEERNRDRTYHDDDDESDDNLF